MWDYITFTKKYYLPITTCEATKIQMIQQLKGQKQNTEEHDSFWSCC